MIQGIYNNLFQTTDLGTKPDGTKRYLKASDDIQAIENKLASGVSVDDLTEEEYKKLNAFERAESSAFHTQIFTEIGKAEAIALKIAKGEPLTPEEERLINDKYPDLKQKAEQAKKEGEELKSRLKSAKSATERNQIAMNAMSSVSAMMDKGGMPPIDAKIKLAAIQKVIEEESKEDKKGQLINMSNQVIREMPLKPGAFIDTKG